MATVTEVFVDASASGSNNGTSLADAYTGLQNAIDNTTLGAGGTRINVKGTQTLTAALDFTSGFSGSPSNTQPLIIQGITATPGDGGRMVIDGTTNSVTIMTDAGTIGTTIFIDGDLETDVADCLHMDANLILVNCKVAGDDEHMIEANSVIAFGCAFMPTDGSGTNSVVINTDQNTANHFFGCYWKAVANTDTCLETRRMALFACIFDYVDCTVAAANIFGPREGSLVAYCSAAGSASITNSGGGAFRFNAYNAHACFNCAAEGYPSGRPIMQPDGNPTAAMGMASYDMATLPGAFDDAGGYTAEITDAASVVFGTIASRDFTAANDAQKSGWPQSYDGISTNNRPDPGAVQYNGGVPSSETTYRMNMQLFINTSS